MKALLILAILACAFAADHHHINMVQLNKIKAIKEQKNTASFLFDLAELHAYAQGPMEELLEAIGQALTDLNEKLEQTHTDFAVTTDQHESEVARLNGLINKCISQIQQTNDNLNEVLYVLKGQLESKIANLEKEIEDTQEYIKLKTAENKARREEFETRQKEHTEAIQVLEKCMDMLGELNGDDFSLAQLREKKDHIHKFHDQIKMKSHLVEQSMISALVELASSEFADKQALQKVINLLTESRNNLVASLAKEIADDKAASKEFAEDMSNKNNYIERCRSEINDATKQLEITNSNIEESLNFIARRKADLAKNQKDLAAENEAYEEATKRYEELVAQIQSEQAACKEAVEILQKGDFADYIGDRIDNADNKGNKAWQAQDSVAVDAGWSF